MSLVHDAIAQLCKIMSAPKIYRELMCLQKQQHCNTVLKYLTITIVLIASICIPCHLVTLTSGSTIATFAKEDGAVAVRIFNSWKYFPCHRILADSQSTD